jgi:lipoyl(octanoyl) transferase
MSPVRPQWLGRLPYRWAWRLQHLRRQAVIAGHAPEAFWLLTHDPVITTGRRPVQGLPHGIDVVRTERGGLATYHGPGQLVGYLILDVARRTTTVKETICAVEGGIIAWLAEEGVHGHRRAGYPGIWVGTDKICAIGMHFRRGVSMHGFALNLTVDLSGFSSIIPCGITDGGVTSLDAILGDAPEPRQVADEVGDCLVDTLGLFG